MRFREFRKKASLANIYCDVREEAEESIEESRTMNCRGLLAHSLLLSKVFIGDCFDLLCRKFCANACLLLNFSSIIF